MAKRQYYDQFVEETDYTAAEKESTDCSATEKGENGGHFVTEAK